MTIDASASPFFADGAPLDTDVDMGFAELVWALGRREPEEVRRCRRELDDVADLALYTSSVIAQAHARPPDRCSRVQICPLEATPPCP